MKEKSVKKQKKIVKYTTLLLLVSLTLAVLFCLMFDDAFALTAKDKAVTLSFGEDTGMWKASAELKKNGLIRSRIWFCAYTSLRGKGFDVKAGKYTLYSFGGFDSYADVLAGK